MITATGVGGFERSVQAPGSCGGLAGSLADILDELGKVVASLTDAQFRSRLGPEFAGATIGGHVRHCLDHVRAVTGGVRAGLADYDHRERGTDIETSPRAAAAEIIAETERVRMLAEASAGRALDVAVMPMRDGRSVTLGSTLGRELAFVVSHTVHHCATIRGMVVSLGVGVPSAFGYAPSTLSHLDQSGCAR